MRFLFWTLLALRDISFIFTSFLVRVRHQKYLARVRKSFLVLVYIHVFMTFWKALHLLAYQHLKHIKTKANHRFNLESHRSCDWCDPVTKGSLLCSCCFPFEKSFCVCDLCRIISQRTANDAVQEQRSHKFATFCCDRSFGSRNKAGRRPRMAGRDGIKWQTIEKWRN